MKEDEGEINMVTIKKGDRKKVSFRNKRTGQWVSIATASLSDGWDAVRIT